MKKSNTSNNQSKTEIALKESEQRYRTTMMSVGDGVIATDTKGRIEMMNPVAEALTGWKQEKSRGKSLEEIFHIINEDTRLTVENPVRRVMREGIVVGLANHSVLIAKDGTEHPIADSGAPIRNEKGDITGVVLVFRDQTQERTAQKALQESERKFRETLKYLDEGYYSCMMDGIVLGHNEAFNRILGIDISKDMKGSKLPDFWLNPDDRKVYLLELMTNGFIRNFLINAKTIGGEKVVVLVNSHLVKDEQGKPVRIEGTFTDFTRMKLLEESLQESETKYRTLFENAQVGMYRTKMDGSEFLDVNKKFAEIIGFSHQELIGSPGRIRWADPEDRDKMIKLIREQSGILNNYEARVLDKNGEVRDVIASIRLHPDEGSLDGTMVDITERKLAERKLRKLNRIYSLLSDINQAIVRTREPEELYDKVCKIAVEQGGFGMAWIGLIDELSQKLRVIAQAGRTNGYHEQVNISLKGKPLNNCPIDSTLRQGGHNIYKIVENNEMVPCQKIAYDLGFRSSASFPLNVSNVLKGTLNFYSDEPEFFDEEELKLLDELALDISFAMEHAQQEAGRKQAEIMLREEKDRIRTILDLVGDPIFVKDNDHHVTLANRAFYDIFCLNENSVIGYTLAEAVPENERQHFLEVDRRVLDTGISDLREEELTVSDLTRTIITRKTRFIDESGKRFLVGSIHDITERKQAEETLQASEARYKTLVENIPQKILMKDINYRWISINENLARDFGISPEEVVGKLDRDLFSIELADKYHADDVRIITTGKTEELEEKYVVDGKETWVNTIKTPVRDKNGEIVGVLGIFWDITGRKLAEETLRIKNQVFEDSIASQSVADSAGTITHVNPAFLRLWGYSSKEQAIGNSVGSFFADQADAIPVLEALATHDAWEGEFLAKRTDGTTFISRGFATSLRNIRGELVGYQSTNLDVTKEREAEEEIRILNTELEVRVAMRTSQLEASFKELEAFSYSVSHDLRAPLRHVSGYVELLNKHFLSDLPEKGQHYLNSIADAVRIMGMLIDDLLQFSRTGRMEMYQSDCDMNEIVKEIIESLRKDNPDRKIEWVQGKLPSVYGDEAMLKLVWMNLLSNAVKFTRTRSKARIEIGVRKEIKELVFFVRDNGVGFDMQYAQKLFGVFQRLHSTEEFEGTGIGLANVHRIVLRHGGRTWAKAEIDKGAEFNFSIPINKEEI